jgi:ATP-dependent Clp protease ATP-binding subunit ClpC
MFERCTDRTRLSFLFARQEVSRLSAVALDTTHLLLGILRDRGGIADLVAPDVAEAICQRIVRDAGLHPPTPTGAEVPFTDAVKRVIEAAAGEADDLGHPHVGTEHLLVAMAAMKGNDGIDELLASHGLGAELLRQQLRTRTPSPLVDPSLGRVSVGRRQES